MTPARVISGMAAWAIIRGDCTEVLARLAAHSVTHVITDPPYSEHVHSKQRRMLRGRGGRKAARKKGGGHYRAVGLAPLDFASLSASLRASSAAHFARITQRWVLAFSDVEGCGDWRDDAVAAGLRHVRQGAWVKLCAQPQLSGDRPGTGHEAIEIAHSATQRCRWNGGGKPAIWTHAIATDRNGNNRVHTTQKPLSLMLDLIRDFTDPGDIVLDPFCGSGTTGVACIRLGRRFIGVELSPKYASTARERLKAESNGIDIGAARSGQIGLFGEP